MHRKIIEFLSTVSGKITIIVVIGILAVAGIQTVRNQAAESQAETDIADDSDDSDESVQKEVPEAVKLTGKEYIGNELYYYREKPKVPVGCIEAAFYDLDEDGQDEIVSVENKDTDFDFVPTLHVYKEKGDKWKEAASTEIDLSKIIDDDSFAQKYVKLFTYDNQIAVQYKTGVNESVVDIYSYSDSGEIKCKLDANVRTTDLHRDGDIFCELFTQKITKEWIDEYQSGWSVKSHDCYVVNFVNYSNLSTYQADDFGFSYPSYYDQYVDFTPKTEEDRGEQYLRICADVKMLSPVEYGGKKVSVFDIAETAYEPRDYMTDYEYSDFPTLEMSEVKLYGIMKKNVSSILWLEMKLLFYMRLHLKIVI